MVESFPLEFILNVKNNMSAGINQAKGDIKGLGDEADKTQQKAKSSGMGIGAAFQFTALNAFNLATSLIATKRGYEDLTKAENAQISKKEAVIKTTLRLENAEGALFKARKSGDPIRIAKAENGLTTARLNAGKAIRNEKQGQIDLNRAHEDFYLSIIPNVISGIGTMAGVMQVFKGVTITAGGALKTFILPLAGITLAFAALKTNFLGITTFFQNLGKDIGNAVPALKPFLELIEGIFATLGIGDTSKAKGLNNIAKQFMDSFKPLIDFFKTLIDTIMKGDWEGAFNTIKEAAMAFWESLKKEFPFINWVDQLLTDMKNGNWANAFANITRAAQVFWEDLKVKVPFLGSIEWFILKIKEGKWEEAFAAIGTALVDAWETVKEKVPFFAGVEAFILAIKNGDWAGAWAIVAKGAVDALGAIFGPDTVTKWVQQLQQIPAKIIAIMNMPGQNAGQKVLNILDAIIPTDIKRFGAQMATWAIWFITELANQIKIGLTGLAHLYIDPFLVNFFSEEAWKTAITAFAQAGLQIVRFLLAPIIEAFQNPEEAGKAGGAFIDGLVEWFETNLPKTTEAARMFAAQFAKAITSIPENFVALAKGFFSMLSKAITDTFTAENLAKLVIALARAIRAAANDARAVLTDLGTYIWKIIGHGLTAAARATFDLLKKASPFGGLLPSPGGGRASGMHTTVSGPRLLTVGERGPERVDITPMSDMVGVKKSMGGTGSGGIITVIVPVSLDGRVIAEVVANRMNQNQGVWK